MAVKKSKKKAVKKAAKKVVKKVVKKAIAAAAEEVSKRIPLSKFVCGMLLDAIPDEEIVEAMAADYPDKDCTQKTVSWYRYAINQGRMEKAGFPCPEGGLINPRREKAAKRKAEKAEKVSNKQATKKATKKVSRRKKDLAEE